MLEQIIAVEGGEEVLGIGFTEEEMEDIKNDPFFSEDDSQVIPEDVTYGVTDGFMSETLAKTIDEFKEREAVGVSKYGTSIDRKDLDASQWLQHLKEELMDATLYVQRVIDYIANRGRV